MKRIVMAIGNNYPGYNQKCGSSGLIDDIFAKSGKLISENEIVVTCGDSYPENADTFYPVDIINAYDRVKYKYGYSKEIIAVFTRVEIRKISNPSVQTGDNYTESGIPENRKTEEFLEPIDIPEKSAIMTLMSDGYLPIIIGAGFPVVRELQYYNNCHGMVNNYSSSSLLGTLIEADELIIISGHKDEFEGIVNSGKLLKNITFNALMDIYKSGHFNDNITGKKIKAMLDFISKGGKKAILMSADMDNVITLIQ
ncbi:amino acid kinase family protein [Ferroplasma acidarmanus]|uniref:Carbamate kinase n=1 Tax=Ferroplasma acidarmanus Fer1 TaxID=333146 RepID=S0AQG4_FERAC|nr:carbamate kinase [Ferroplasma acidarmanus]AGO61022.1 carbamate kinase [Ferroplasma acidarmanus Fer1]